MPGNSGIIPVTTTVHLLRNHSPDVALCLCIYFVLHVPFSSYTMVPGAALGDRSNSSSISENNSATFVWH